MSRDMDEVWAAWDAGEHVFSEVEDALMAVKPGEVIGDVLSKCTICPVGNGTCEQFMEVSCYGILPGQIGKIVKVMVCTIGVVDIDHCPLSK